MRKIVEIKEVELDAYSCIDDCDDCEACCVICQSCCENDIAYITRTDGGQVFTLCESCGTSLKDILEVKPKPKRRTTKAKKVKSTLPTRSTVSNVFGGSNENSM